MENSELETGFADGIDTFEKTIRYKFVPGPPRQKVQCFKAAKYVARIIAWILAISLNIYFIIGTLGFIATYPVETVQQFFVSLNISLDIVARCTMALLQLKPSNNQCQFFARALCGIIWFIGKEDIGHMNAFGHSLHTSIWDIISLINTGTVIPFLVLILRQESCKENSYFLLLSYMYMYTDVGGSVGENRGQMVQPIL
ncbi:hypothetical protein G9A89_017879 [Geosiphon pyriformis]|nr:hypothetical protein G9A89_017879 [Geosiphon pyriformis]